MKWRARRHCTDSFSIDAFRTDGMKLPCLAGSGIFAGVKGSQVQIDNKSQ